ncbi:hypothetical protein [Actinocrispum sp. NPDC049592]|uniref:hypothetical protein n=1 Tax=Actinocrispum sp. NPDC049592 TaxID=3154835 RepID=UPI003435E12F
MDAALGRRCPGDREDLCAEILRGFLEALCRIDVDRPRIVLRLRWAAYRAGYAVLVDALAAKNHSAGEYAQPVVWGHPDFVLARAVAEGILTTTEADLIGTTRLESVRIKRWAVEHGMGDWAAYKARRRAELRLAAWLQEDRIDSDPADALVDRVATVVAIGKAKPVSKGDQQSGLQADDDLPPTTASEARPCA